MKIFITNYHNTLHKLYYTYNNFLDYSRVYQQTSDHKYFLSLNFITIASPFGTLHSKWIWRSKGGTQYSNSHTLSFIIIINHFNGSKLCKTILSVIISSEIQTRHLSLSYTHIESAHHQYADEPFRINVKEFNKYLPKFSPKDLITHRDYEWMLICIIDIWNQETK